MADIRSRGLLYLKAGLFVVVGLLASVLLLTEHPEWRVLILLGVAVWAFARAYYFAFYVVEHYVDRQYRFSGLWSFAAYLLRRRKPAVQNQPAGEAR
jgi:hypothetical protein